MAWKSKEDQERDRAGRMDWWTPTGRCQLAQGLSKGLGSRKLRAVNVFVPLRPLGFKQVPERVCTVDMTKQCMKIIYDSYSENTHQFWLSNMLAFSRTTGKRGWGPLLLGHPENCARQESSVLLFGAPAHVSCVFPCR